MVFTIYYKEYYNAIDNQIYDSFRYPSISVNPRNLINYTDRGIHAWYPCMDPLNHQAHCKPSHRVSVHKVSFFAQSWCILRTTPRTIWSADFCIDNIIFWYRLAIYVNFIFLEARQFSEIFLFSYSKYVIDDSDIWDIFTRSYIWYTTVIHNTFSICVWLYSEKSQGITHCI